MKLSQIKQVKNFCNDLFSTPSWRDVLENIINEETDFEVEGVRFIDSEYIDGIQEDELSGDLYCLGCFNAWFLADVLEIDQDVIEEMQKAEAFTAIGKLVVSMGKLSELQQGYASADGYGHHFNGYDGGEEELYINSETIRKTYHVFDNH